MIYAQILAGLVVNTIDLDDSSLVDEFTVGFDALVEIDALSPMPAINWYWDGTTFYAPLQIALVVAGVVTCVELGSTYTIANPPAGTTAVGVSGMRPNIRVGFTYNGSTFTPNSAFYAQLLADSTSFGNQVINSYLLQVMNLGILPSGQSPALLNYCSTLFTYLTHGMLPAAVGAITTMIADTSDTKNALTPYLTNAILGAIELQIVTWMNSYQ